MGIRNNLEALNMVIVMKNKQEKIEEDLQELRRNFDHQRNQCKQNHMTLANMIKTVENESITREKHSKLLEQLLTEQQAHQIIMDQFKESIHELRTDFKEFSKDIRDEVKEMTNRIVDAISMAQEHKIWGMAFLKISAGIVTLLSVLKMLGYI